jgi:hypothetical protein
MFAITLLVQLLHVAESNGQFIVRDDELLARVVALDDADSSIALGGRRPDNNNRDTVTAVGSANEVTITE